MATLATDGKGNYVTLDDSGNWVPTAAPTKGQGELGYPPAPPEQDTKPPPIDFANRPMGPQPDASGLGLSLPQGGDSGAVGRVGSAIAEGFNAPPFQTPELEAKNREANQGTWVGRNVVQPIVSLSEVPFRALGALGAGIGQGVYEAGAAIDPRLGRDLYMLNQLTPAFGMEIPGGATSPRNVLNPDAARTAAVDRAVAATPPTPTANFVPEYYGQHAPGTPVTLDDLTSAINRAGQPQQDMPPVPGGLVRLYHGGANDPTTGGERWVTPSYAYAQSYSPSTGSVWYADVPADHPAVVAATDTSAVEGTGMKAPISSFNAPEDIAKRMQPAPTRYSQPGDEPPQSPPQPPPAAPPVPTTAPADPPIMSQADIQARSRDLFKLPDQSAAGGAMLPDANAAAVRKIFSDFIPADTEAANISAGDPALQAAKNVLPTGPMSYDTAMRIDRNLTARMRGASGSDAHDLSQLQQALRDQMDQVPDLENLRPARQAWMQSIKQGQMEDINEGAALKNDPAQADAYVRQRAAALLKNNNAMRYWTPEEQAQLTQVAQSGNIGMLGRLATALIKPATRVVLGTAGHAVAGPLGAIIGGEVGGDVGATAASRFRSYLSPTDLSPVMQQITRGVPPPNQLGPQAVPVTTTAVPPVNPAVMANLQAQLAASRARQAQWQQQTPPS